MNLRALSTSLLLSMVALPVSVVAFAIIYTYEDPFWSLLWVGAVLPTIWIVVTILVIRDTWKRRPWRSIVGGPLLLAPTVLLVCLMLTPRFAFHQLFTFRPLDLQIPTKEFFHIEKFAVCTEQVPCTPRSTATKTLTLTKLPDRCCSLQLVNGLGGEHKVQAVRVMLNGREVSFAPGPLQMASVKLDKENEITVQLTGSTDAYVYVVIRSSADNAPHGLEQR